MIDVMDFKRIKLWMLDFTMLLYMLVNEEATGAMTKLFCIGVSIALVND